MPITGAFTGIGVKPTVTGASMVASTVLRVTFSEAMQTAGLSDTGNYTINEATPGTDRPLTVTLATPEAGGNPTYVDLTLDGETTKGASNYTIICSTNIKDTVGNPLETAGQQNEAIFSGTGIAPIIKEIETDLADLTKVVVTFSEDLRQGIGETYDPEDEANYVITGGTVTVDSVTKIGEDEYQLNVSNLEVGPTYTLTVSNVQDLGWNPIGPPGNQKNFFVVAATAAVFTFDPVDGTIGYDPAETFRIHVVDQVENFSGVDRDTWQLDLKYIVNGVLLTIPVIQNGQVTTYVDGQITGDPNTTIGLTVEFILPGGFPPNYTYTLETEVYDVDGYFGSETAIIGVGTGLDRCEFDHLWKLVPEAIRRRDAKEDDVLYDFVDSMRESFSGICQKISDFDTVRDSYTVRSAYDENVRVNTEQAVVDVDKNIVTLSIDEDNDLTDASAGWVLDDGAALYLIEAVRKKIPGPTMAFPNDQDPEIDIAGNVIPNLDYLLINNENVGSGDGINKDFTDTLENTKVVPSSVYIYYLSATVLYVIQDDGAGNLTGSVDGAGTNTIDYVTGDISFRTLNTPDAASDLTCNYQQQFNGTIRPQEMINQLALDYGFEIDANESEDFQRSSIINVWKWLELKGSIRAFQIRGLISGFNVTIFPLWKTQSVGGFPIGSYSQRNGDYFTRLPPARGRFDDMPADVIPTDTFCWESIDILKENVTVDSVVENLDGTWTVTLDPTEVLDYISSLGNWKLVDARDSWETIANGDGGRQTFVAVFSEPECSPGTLSIRYTSSSTLYTITDDGFGNLIGDVDDGGVNTVDYDSGDLNFKCLHIPDDATVLEAQYKREFWIESLGGGSPETVSLNTYEVGPVGGSGGFPATFAIRYVCDYLETCSYCKTNFISGEIEAGEILNDPGADVGGSMVRMARKLYDVIPAHVEFFSLVYKTFVEAEVSYTVDVDLSPLARVFAPMKAHFDTITADE